MSDRAYAALSLGAVAGALVAPVLVYRAAATLASRTTRGRQWIRVGGGLSSLLVALTVSPLLLMIAVCWGPPAGESDDARATKAAADPVIAALVTFHQRNGRYPDKLSDLSPSYIAPELLTTLRIAAPLQVEYRVDSGGYRLRFEYTGPGMNHCEF